MTNSETTKRSVDIDAGDENHAPAAHTGNTRTTKPFPARARRRETELLNELLDGPPASEIARASRGVVRALSVLRARRAHLELLLAAQRFLS